MSTDAWDVFIASIDRALLESERMRAPRNGERFGSRQHFDMVQAHTVNVYQFRLRKQPTYELIPTDRQLQIAIDAYAMRKRAGKR